MKDLTFEDKLNYAFDFFELVKDARNDGFVYLRHKDLPYKRRMEINMYDKGNMLVFENKNQIDVTGFLEAFKSYPYFYLETSSGKVFNSPSFRIKHDLAAITNVDLLVFSRGSIMLNIDCKFLTGAGKA